METLALILTLFLTVSVVYQIFWNNDAEHMQSKH